MIPSHRTALVAIIVVVICFGGYLTVRFFSALDAQQCSVTVKHQVASPHRRRIAVVFEKDCGATTPFNTQVSIAAPTARFSSDESPSFLSLKGEHTLTVTWLDDDTVQIEIPKGVEAFRRESHAGGVTILYR